MIIKSARISGEREIPVREMGWMDDKELVAIRERAEKATPGPWGWDANTTGHCIRLARKAGWGDIVMDFRRWGMQGAAPAFVEDGLIEPITKHLKPRAAHHPTFDLDVDHPDAQFIAHARQDIPALLAEVDRLTRELAAANKRFEDMKPFMNFDASFVEMKKDRDFFKAKLDAAQGREAKMQRVIDAAERLAMFDDLSIPVGGCKDCGPVDPTDYNEARMNLYEALQALAERGAEQVKRGIHDKAAFQAHKSSHQAALQRAEEGVDPHA